MLWSFLGLLLALYVIQSAVKSGLALRRNIAAAKQTGLPYFITPFSPPGPFPPSPTEAPSVRQGH